MAENVPANGATVGAITSMAIAFDEPITSKGCSPGTNVTLMEVGSMYGSLPYDGINFRFVSRIDELLNF